VVPHLQSYRARVSAFCKQAENESPGRIKFFEVNFKENKQLCLQERVYQLPAIHFYTKGLGRVNRFVLTTATASKRLAAQTERYLGESGHLELLQSLRSTALSPMVQYVDLVNVARALADAPKLLQSDETSKKSMLTEAVGSEQSREKLERLFDRLDTNANGMLDPDELEAIMRAVGGGGGGNAQLSVPPVDLTLDRDAFVQLMTSKLVADFDRPDKALLPAFQAMDADGDGAITREEVLSAIQRLPGMNEGLVLESQQAFDALDVDKSGTLDYEEFVTAMSGGRFEDAYGD